MFHEINLYSMSIKFRRNEPPSFTLNNIAMKNSSKFEILMKKYHLMSKLRDADGQIHYHSLVDFIFQMIFI